MIYYYNVHGLRIASTLEIPELSGSSSRASSDDDSQIRIELGKTPVELERPVSLAAGYEVSGKQCLLSIPSCARYLVTSGQTITIEPARGAYPSEVRLYLLGSAFAALLHQRGLVPLHASAIALKQGCVVFLGGSGVGKSTLATMLAVRGFRLMSDDVVVARRGEDGTIFAAPSSPTIKLWPEAVQHLGRGLDAASERVDCEKHHFHMGTNFEVESRRLCRLYFLHWLLPRDAEPEIERVPPFDALVGMRRNVFREGLISPLGREAELLGFLGELLGQVDAYDFRRPMNYGFATAQLDALERHILGQDWER